jgi:hypothetical protein
MFATAVGPEPREIKLHDHFQREAFAPDQATIRARSLPANCHGSGN